MKNTSQSLDKNVQDRLVAAGVAVAAAQWDQLNAFIALVHEWNPVAGLVSRGDAAHGLAAHTADSLSLVAHLQADNRAAHLDIGSGGGFPAIPLAILTPARSFLLLERGMRKCGFLTKAVAALGLENVEIQQGAFPALSHPGLPISITARAVERPEQLHGHIARWMQSGDHFYNQAGDWGAFAPGMFHVEHITDGWTDAGLRRGTLDRITCRQ